ncbi:MAG: hypothetical protein R3D84_04965 [Paracoccaceae bacterium]
MTMPSQIEIEAETVPWRALFGRDHLGALLMVCLGVWLHAADSLVVATMMPAIVADIGASGWWRGTSRFTRSARSLWVLPAACWRCVWGWAAR